MEKVLLFQPGPLGDSFFTGALADIIKKEYPNTEIHFYTSETATEMMQDSPFIDNFITETGKTLKDIRNLRKTEFDFIIDTLATGRSFYKIAFSKAKHKVAFKRKKKDILKKLFFIYTDLIPYESCGYVFWDRLKLLSSLKINYKTYIDSKYLPNFHLSEEMKEKVLNFLKNNRLNEFILISPKGKWNTKSIPIKTTANLVDILENEFKKKVVLASSPQDLYYIRKIKELSSADPAIFSSQSIREFAALIYFSKHLISVESLPYHIALGLRKSATVVLGAYPIWKPDIYDKITTVSLNLHCQPCSRRTCKYNNIQCLSGISAELIIEKARNFIQ